MPRATCRCGQKLSLPVNGPDRVICPKCQARVRVRKGPALTAAGADAFVRFDCPCGRRLKVRAAPGGTLPVAGKCPDCGRVVPVPPESTASSSHAAAFSRTADPETGTEELDSQDLAALGEWSRRHEARRQPVAQLRSPVEAPAAASRDEPTWPAAASPTKTEAGLRVCPRCGRPVHLSAVTCRECGSAVPKR